jgi:hypothetical protein
VKFAVTPKRPSRTGEGSQRLVACTPAIDACTSRSSSEKWPILRVGSTRSPGGDLNNLNKKWGGARPNSEPKKGAKYAKTVAKEQAREIVREIITRECSADSATA